MDEIFNLKITGTFTKDCERNAINIFMIYIQHLIILQSYWTSSTVTRVKIVYLIAKQNGIIIIAIMVKMLSLNAIHNKILFDKKSYNILFIP